MNKKNLNENCRIQARPEKKAERKFKARIRARPDVGAEGCYQHLTLLIFNRFCLVKFKDFQIAHSRTLNRF